MPRWNALNGIGSRGTKPRQRPTPPLYQVILVLFRDFCRFRKLRYFIKLHLFKAARSTEIWRNPPISESY